MIFCKFLPHKGNLGWKVPLKVIYTFYLKHQKYPFCAPIFHPLSETESYCESCPEKQCGVATLMTDPPLASSNTLAKTEEKTEKL